MFYYFNLKFNIYKMLILNTFVLIVYSLFLHFNYIILYIMLYNQPFFYPDINIYILFIFMFFSSLIYTKSSIRFKLLFY